MGLIRGDRLGLSLSLVALGTGCQVYHTAPPHLGQAMPGETAIVDKPTGNAKANTNGGGQVVSGGGANSVSDDTAGPISHAGRLLIGRLLRPDTALIGNNSASLTDIGGGVFLSDIGGGVFYKVSGLSAGPSCGNPDICQVPVAGAVVTLEGPDGEPLESRSVTTDADGRFAIALETGATGPVFVNASFQEGGKAYSFTALADVPAGATGSVDIDAATTMVGAKLRLLRRSESIDLTAIGAERLLPLLDKLRDRLSRDLVPCMASGSADVVSAFDQLALDDAELGAEVAKVAARLAAPAVRWSVSKVFDSHDLIRLGVYGAGQTAFNGAGTFEVDRDGNLYFPRFARTASGSVEIWQVTQAGATSSFATLPAGYVNPVLQAFAPDGTYFAAAMDAGSRLVRVFKGKGSLTPEAGALAVVPEGGRSLLGGRIAVDASGNVAWAAPELHVILYKPPGESARILAGRLPESGFADGSTTDARFSEPGSAIFGPDGALYVADSGNGSIRRVMLDGTVKTMAGAPGTGPYRNGRGAFARFGKPESLAIRDRGLFVTDRGSNRVRLLTRSGYAVVVAGNGVPDIVDGLGDQASLNQPSFLTIDGAGNLYLGDGRRATEEAAGYQVVRKISPP